MAIINAARNMTEKDTISMAGDHWKFTLTMTDNHLKL